MIAPHYHSFQPLAAVPPAVLLDDEEERVLTPEGADEAPDVFRVKRPSAAFTFADLGM